MSRIFLWLIGIPFIHMMLIEFILPGAGFVGMLLILDVGIVCGYAAKKPDKRYGVIPMILAFDVGRSYLGAVLTYFASCRFWEAENPVIRGLALVVAFGGVYTWMQFPLKWIGVIRN